MTNYLIMFGAPASGKGTHSGILSKVLGIPCISTGDMLRELLAKPDEVKTDLEREIASVMEAGGLVSDEHVLKLVRQRIAQPDCREGCIFDGFPRTLTQKNELDKILAVDGKRVKGVIRLDVEREALITRFLGRVQETIEVGGTPRKDDNRESFVVRLETYRTWTAPVLDAYRENGTLIQVVNANGERENTAASVKQAASAILSNGLSDTLATNAALRAERGPI